MFAAKANNSRKAISDEANDSTVTEVIEKKGGMAFNIQSSVSKLPPINLNRAQVPLVEDYEKLKGRHIFIITHVKHVLFLFSILFSLPVVI